MEAAAVLFDEGEANDDVEERSCSIMMGLAEKKIGAFNWQIFIASNNKICEADK